MSRTPVALRPAAPDELADVERLLAAAGLPSSDVRAKPDCFYVARVDGDQVGVGGLERHGSDGLLRSVAVEPQAQGRGVGTAICDRLEAEARTEGVDALYLLTTTAAGFFADRGYAEIDRADAPAAIRRTTEFAELCPASATCLRKQL